MNKYEYIVKTYEPHHQLDQINIDMNNLGNDGWELIQILDTSSQTHIAYFKRLKQS